MCVQSKGHTRLIVWTGLKKSGVLLPTIGVDNSCVVGIIVQIAITLQLLVIAQEKLSVCR